MSTNRLLLLAAIVPCTALSAAIAQPAQPPAANAGAAAQAVPAYRSPFETYRPYAQQPLVPWRDTNDTVGRIGGWRAYADEAQSDAPDAEGAASGRHRGHATP